VKRPHPVPPPDVLKRLRSLCARLPDVTEVAAWGHPNFQCRGKTFAVLEAYQGQWAIAFRTELARQQHWVETDSRFYVTPYLGKRGWVSFRIGQRVPWRNVRAWLGESHRLTAEAAPKARPRRR
jgi:predicted DNA-binding protein (MmcQ/YjbR family)